MTRPLAWALGLVTMFLLVTALPAALQAKSAAPARSCYDCHSDLKKTWAKKFVHEPVAKADCAACHLSHGFQQ
ncbi:MAG: hypothetical protein K8R56_04475, partial [Candidatus Eisenbacteria bacterium]|nr:hypothetical protein [Candidatus Eisenbacteria bacterium]